MLPRLFRRRPSSLPPRWCTLETHFIYSTPPRVKGGKWSAPAINENLPIRLLRADLWSKLSGLSYRVGIGTGLDTFAWTQFWDRLTWLIEELEATHHIQPFLLTGRPDIANRYLAKADPYLLARTTLILRQYAHKLREFHVEHLLESPTRYNAVMLVDCWNPIDIPGNLARVGWILSRPAKGYTSRKEFAHGPPWRCQWELLRFAHTHRVPFFNMASQKPIHVAVRQFHTGARLANVLAGPKPYRYFSPMRRRHDPDLARYDLPTVALPWMPETNWGLDYFKSRNNLPPSSES